MSDSKENKFNDSQRITCGEFCALLFGIVNKSEFIILKKEEEKKGLIGVDISLQKLIGRCNDTSPLFKERCKKALQVLEFLNFCEDEGDLTKFIIGSVTHMRTEPPIDPKGITYQEMCLREEVTETIYAYRFSKLFSYFTEKYDTNLDLFADWIYFLLKNPVPSHSSYINNTEIIVDNQRITKKEFDESYVTEEYVMINSLPKLLQLANKTYLHFKEYNQDISSTVERNDYKKSVEEYLKKEAINLEIPHTNPKKKGEIGLSKTSKDTIKLMIKVDN